MNTNSNRTMSQRTVSNEVYRGLVEAMAIPAELHKRQDGRPYATFGGVIPIHCADEAQVKRLSETTHHYCDLFTEEVLAPLGELAYVRLDEKTAEKVFINRVKRILLVSADGRLAQWRAAPSFESANRYVAGAPVVNKDGALVSLVTARKGNHYAVSTFEGEAGYFDTSLPWLTLDTAEGALVYGDRTFRSRDELRAYVAALPPGAGDAPSGPLSGPGGPRPVLHRPAGGAAGARLALVAPSGRQLAHVMLNGVVNSAEYL